MREGAWGMHSTRSPMLLLSAPGLQRTRDAERQSLGKSSQEPPRTILDLRSPALSFSSRLLPSSLLCPRKNQSFPSSGAPSYPSYPWSSVGVADEGARSTRASATLRRSPFYILCSRWFGKKDGFGVNAFPQGSHWATVRQWAWVIGICPRKKLVTYSRCWGPSLARGSASDSGDPIQTRPS